MYHKYCQTSRHLGRKPRSQWPWVRNTLHPDVNPEFPNRKTDCQQLHDVYSDRSLIWTLSVSLCNFRLDTSMHFHFCLNQLEYRMSLDACVCLEQKLHKISDFLYVVSCPADQLSFCDLWIKVCYLEDLCPLLMSYSLHNLASRQRLDWACYHGQGSGLRSFIFTQKSGCIRGKEPFAFLLMKFCVKILHCKKSTILKLTNKERNKVTVGQRYSCVCTVNECVCGERRGRHSAEAGSWWWKTAGTASGCGLMLETVRLLIKPWTETQS